MRVAVIGSRDYDDIGFAYEKLDKLNSIRKITMIVSGGAGGADAIGKLYAQERGIRYWEFPAKWDDLSQPDARIKVNKWGNKYDANAGHRRNKQIVDNCDVMVAFHIGNSPGTANSIKYANEVGKPIKVFSL